MNRLSVEDRVQILTVLSEGAGINAACRITGKSKNTVLKLLAEVGRACALYQDQAMRNLSCKQIQVDEIWSFVGMKQKNVPKESDPEDAYGDCYTFTAIDPETKLMPCWLVGARTWKCTFEFMEDLASRMTPRNGPDEYLQLTTDGMEAYPHAVEAAFGMGVHFAVLTKTYAGVSGAVEAKRRYSPAAVTGVRKTIVKGSPDKSLITTSHVERANLSMRMNMRRFTRLTNAFSKKIENHMHAISFYFMVYNFVRIHASVKTSPAMAAGVATTLWDIKDIVLMSETVSAAD